MTAAVGSVVLDILGVIAVTSPFWGGALIYLNRKKLFDPTVPCPHEFCRHRLPKYGVYDQASGAYVVEPCSVCGNNVWWDKKSETYFRAP